MAGCVCTPPFLLQTTVKEVKRTSLLTGKCIKKFCSQDKLHPHQFGVLIAHGTYAVSEIIELRLAVFDGCWHSFLQSLQNLSHQTKNAIMKKFKLILMQFTGNAYQRFQQNLNGAVSTKCTVA
jgi:hypothetical protein